MQTIDEYVADRIQELNKFLNDWKKNQANDPEGYPASMNAVDWLEQEMSFMGI